jgi:hypothetical protein
MQGQAITHRLPDAQKLMVAMAESCGRGVYRPQQLFLVGAISTL